MPFYLVIQTTLIEADDDQSAAQAAIDQIRSGDRVAVTVKADEATLSHIVVAARLQVDPPAPIAAVDAQARGAPVELDAAIVPETGKKAILKRMLTDASSLIGLRR